MGNTHHLLMQQHVDSVRSFLVPTGGRADRSGGAFRAWRAQNPLSHADNSLVTSVIRRHEYPAVILGTSKRRPARFTAFLPQPNFIDKADGHHGRSPIGSFYG